MVYSDDLLITIDPGHGGWDNGASWMGRLEKDDNLRLGLEVRRQMLAQGIRVLMTRDTDIYVTLQDRVSMANQAGSDLFISLHRNSYTEPTPWTNGVQNFIYLTAPMESTGKAAQYVLDYIVEVGVQSDKGVSRGNYYVLRRTVMPAMLLELGYIINEIDNQLFDEHLEEYAAAIVRGVMRFFGLEFKEQPGVTPAPPPNICPECPECPTVGAWGAQQAVNERFGLDMPVSGFFDAETNKAMVKALQMSLNKDFNAGLVVDGILGPKTLAAFPNVFAGQRGNLVFVIQALLHLNKYNPGEIDGEFGSATKTAVQMFQRDNYLTADGIVGQETIKALFAHHS